MNLDQFLAKFTNQKLFDKEKIFRHGNELFLVASQLSQVQEKSFSFIGKNPFFIGEFIGVETPHKVIPSLSLLNRLNKVSVKKAVVNEKGEWLFACGRDLWKESIIKLAADLNNDDFLLIVNELDEPLGIGILKQDKHCFVKNYFDIGDFFRREH